MILDEDLGDMALLIHHRLPVEVIRIVLVIVGLSSIMT